MSAGKLTNEPPPASAFIAPASNPAEKTNNVVFMDVMLVRTRDGRNVELPVLDFGNSER
jgi:hypothetical protein